MEGIYVVVRNRYMEIVFGAPGAMTSVVHMRRQPVGGLINDTVTGQDLKEDSNVTRIN